MSTRRKNPTRVAVEEVFAARLHYAESRRHSGDHEPSVRSQRVSALSSRLEEALVFIINQDGTREYQKMTLRELYNYVLAAVAKRPKAHGKSMKRASTIPVPSVLDVNQDQSESFVSALSVSDKDGGGEIHNVVGAEDIASEDKKQTEAGVAEDVHSVLTDVRGSSSKKVSFTTFDSPQNQADSSTAAVAPSTAAVAPGAAGNVTYRDRLGGYLHPRDMRRLVTPFSTSNAPEIMVRRHVILLNCDPLRAIVLRDRLLVLVPDDSESILETLAKRIIGGRAEMEESVFGAEKESTSQQEDPKPSKLFPGLSKHAKTKDTKKSASNVSGDTDATVEAIDETDEESESSDDEFHDLVGRAWIDLPFELKAVDAVLHTVSIMLGEDTELLQEAVYDTIDEVLVHGRAISGGHDEKLLRALKNAIKEMSSRVNNFVRAINESLDDLEDLTLMNLSRLITNPELFIQPVPRAVLEEESDEPELIMEVYMQQALSIQNQLDLLKGQVTTSEELMAMQLDTVRNRLLLIDASVSLVSLTVSVASLVGSIYGMNVINGLEEAEGAFTTIVAGTSAACVGFLALLVFIFYRALVLPNAIKV